MPGDKYPGSGAALATGTWQLWRNSYKTNNVYAGTNKFFAIGDAKKLQAFAFAGLAIATIEAQTVFVDDDYNGTPSASTIATYSKSFTATKLLPMIKLGLEYNIHHKFAWRLVYTWKNYSAFGYIKSTTRPNGAAELRPKDINALALGFYYYL